MARDIGNKRLLTSLDTCDLQLLCYFWGEGGQFWFCKLIYNCQIQAEKKNKKKKKKNRPDIVPDDLYRCLSDSVCLILQHISVESVVLVLSSPVLDLK